jgi:pyruvate ferredoxin oxidoreductase gamma subunit
MFQVRFHGRGGQGVVTGAELLSIAAFREGKHAQAFPSFGSERMGAPVLSFCRIDEREIRLREPIIEPDAIIIQDPTLLHSVDVFQGLKADGYVLLNSSRRPLELGLEDLAARLPLHRLRCVPATELGRQYVGRPFPNAALLGGIAAMTKILRFDSVVAALRERFEPALAERNVAAARAAHDMIAACG